MKSAKTTFLKGLRTFAVVGVFSLVMVMGSFLIPATKSQADTLMVTGSIMASPDTISTGGSTQLSWNSFDATSISISPGIGSVAPSGSVSVSPTQTTIYTLTLSNNSGGSGSATATVYVNQTQQTCEDSSADNYHTGYPCHFPQTCTDSAADNYHTGYPCHYPTYYQRCLDINASNYGSTGSCYYPPVIQVCQDINATNYRGVLPCIYRNINILSVPQPTVTISVDSTSVAFNGSTTVRWSTTNATTCYAAGGSAGWAGQKSIGPASFFTGSLTSSQVYAIACSGPGGTANSSASVNVRGITTTVVSQRPATSSYVVINSSIDRNQPIVPTLDNTRPHPGDEINYTVTYQNVGTASITNLVLRLDLPSEVDYISSTPNTPNISGNTLIFTLGTLRANGTGTVTVRTRVREDIPLGTPLNFPAVLTYTDPSGQTQSVNANVSAQVWSAPADQNVIVQPEPAQLGANAFLAGFLPSNIFGWLLLLVLILLLVLLGRYLFTGETGFSKKTTTTTTIEH